MIKLVMPMKRRPGMSVEEFREYYETRHRLIGEKYLKGYVSKYMRRFTNPNVDRDGQLRDPEYDVFLEIWYPDQETMEACGKKPRRSVFCEEHFLWFKEGLVNRKGEKPKDFDKKHQAFLRRQKQAA